MILDAVGKFDSRADKAQAPRVGSLQKWYTFDWVAGTTYVIRLQATPPFQPWPGDDPYLYLLDADGRVIAENDDGGFGMQDERIVGPGGVNLSAAYLVFVPKVSGRFTVVATTWAAHQEFAFRLSIWGNAPPKGVPNS